MLVNLQESSVEILTYLLLACAAHFRGQKGLSCDRTITKTGKPTIVVKKNNKTLYWGRGKSQGEAMACAFDSMKKKERGKSNRHTDCYFCILANMVARQEFVKMGVAEDVVRALKALASRQGKADPETDTSLN